MNRIIQLLCLFLPALLLSQRCHGLTGKTLFFEENRTQYPSNVEYKADLPGSRLFLEKDRFTYVKYDPMELEEYHDRSHTGQNKAEDIIHLHAFQAIFMNSNPHVDLTTEKRSSFYSNYFIGNQPTKWASAVYSFEQVTYHDLYPGIDLKAYSRNSQFKYDLLIQPGVDPGQIRIRYNGAVQLSVTDRSLVIKTSAGDMTESIPVAYQSVNGNRHIIRCDYQLEDDNVITFRFPDGYDQQHALVIDPVLIAATFSGATAAVTYGHSATYDNNANIYTGGECFSPGYPATLGAFETTFSGATDIVISKLDPPGSNIIWCTYIGGTSAEIPNSLFVNNDDEMYVYGTSGSPDYPVSAGCYDNANGGMHDIVVTHLNSTGTALIGSTYVGGTGEDGWGAGMTGSMNGHDGMRGEIIVDQFNNAWVASYTTSSNFPTSPGTYDATFNGGFDACVIKLSPDLSALLWSTYLGGTTNDTGYGLRLNSSGEVFVTGFTTSSDFPATAGSYQTSFQGGTQDGYIAKFDNTGAVLQAASFYGSTANDISYFIDLDQTGSPNIYGVTTGSMPVTTGVYSNPGARNFIGRLDTNLTAVSMATIVGSSSSYMEPEAFMIDICGNIYIAGFGGSTGYPVTSTAMFSVPTSGTCYLAVLSSNASSLLYGSFYYGGHVDGGTSRFDPGGTIYLGICMGSTVPVPSWALDNSTMSWDMFVLKMDFEMSGVNAIAAVTPGDTICLGQTVSFSNTSNGTQYIWDFGDGSPASTAVTPTHFYAAPGTYTVSLLAIDSASCNIVDTTYLTVDVLPAPIAAAGNDTTICSGSIQLNASGGSSYLWTPTTGLSDPSIADPIATPAVTTTYIVQVSNGGCSDLDTITVFTGGPAASASGGTICQGDSTSLSSAGGMSYSWDPATGLNNTSIADPTASPAMSTTYTVTVVDANGCTATASATVTVNPTVSSEFTISPAPPYYLNDPLIFTDPSTISNTWDFGDGSGSTLQSPDHSYPSPGFYTICHKLITGCADTVCKTIEVTPLDILIPNVVTPNADGQNEYLLFRYLEYYPGSKLEIYNRWGLLLYADDDYQNNWDGSKYSDGVYYFILYLKKHDGVESIPGFFHILKEG